MLSRPAAASAEKLKNSAAPAGNLTTSPLPLDSWEQDCAGNQEAACSPVHSWAASSSTQIAMPFQTLEGCMRHLPSLYYLKGVAFTWISILLNPGCSNRKQTF